METVAHCDSGGPKPKGGGSGPLLFRWPQAPRRLRWLLAAMANKKQRMDNIIKKRAHQAQWANP